MGVKLGLLTFKEEHRLKMCDNRVLRRIFGPNGNKLIGEWRKLYNNSFIIYTLHEKTLERPNQVS
jgi:hypothetical protein